MITFSRQHAIAPKGTSDEWISLNQDFTDYDGNSIFGERIVWWQQAELARAAARWAVVRGLDYLWDDFDGSWALIDQKITDPTYGGRFEALDPYGLDDPTELGLAGTDRKGYEWKVNYHATMLYAELLRLESIPEPQTAVLLGAGALCVLLRRQRV